MPPPPRVLFVSKPIAPPFHDGTKCLVRDVATELVRHRAIVMGVRGAAPAVPGSVECAPVYQGSGAYAPLLRDNARAAAWLALRSRADLWHFVFAPNPRTSTVGKVARALRRVPVVQTVASPPLAFAPDVFFGDLVVAQSRWTRERIVGAFASAGRPAPDVRIVPPPVGRHAAPAPGAVAEVRRTLELPDGAPVFVYPGDLEVSRGADTVARAVPAITRDVPGAVVVFACRAKTREAPRLEAALRSRLEGERVRFAREIDLRALLALSTAVLFPVEDLRGKVDLPISLLEAMQLGVPVLVPEHGPLADLEGAVSLHDAHDAEELAENLADAAARIARDPAAHADAARAGLRAVEARYSASVVAAAYEALYDELLR